MKANTYLPALAIFVASLLALPAVADKKDREEFPGIRALMEQEQFEAAGLDKLSAEELQALDKWLLLYTAGEAQQLVHTNEEVKEAEKKAEITARIKQPFEGWSGTTVFYMEDGQVWRQRLSGRYRYTGDNTDVIIRKNFLGYYVMELTATGKKIGVSRVR